MLITGTIEQARAKLAELVTPSVAPALTDERLDAALLDSRVKDSVGRWITEVDYVPTYDVYYAAALVSDHRAVIAMQENKITDFSSEGSTFTRTLADWSRVAEEFRRRSAADAGLHVNSLSVIEVTREAPLQDLPRFPHLTGVITNAD